MAAGLHIVHGCQGLLMCIMVAVRIYVVFLLITGGRGWQKWYGWPAIDKLVIFPHKRKGVCDARGATWNQMRRRDLVCHWKTWPRKQNKPWLWTLMAVGTFKSNTKVNFRKDYIHNLKVLWHLEVKKKKSCILHRMLIVGIVVGSITSLVSYIKKAVSFDTMEWSGIRTTARNNIHSWSILRTCSSCFPGNCTILSFNI